MTEDEKALDELIGGGYILLSRNLVRGLGPARAVFITYMLQKFKDVRFNKELFEEKWFYYKREDILEQQQMSFETQKKYTDEFRKLNCLDTKMVKDRFGQRIYYCVFPVEILKIAKSIEKKVK